MIRDSNTLNSNIVVMGMKSLTFPRLLVYGNILNINHFIQPFFAMNPADTTLFHSGPAYFRHAKGNNAIVDHQVTADQIIGEALAPLDVFRPYRCGQPKIRGVGQLKGVFVVINRRYKENWSE